jgi:uncharacterized membrane protein (UPF0127 family)
VKTGRLQKDGIENVGTSIRQTTHALERLQGLLGSPEPSAGEGLWITRCNAIHTFFMRYAIDVVFIDAHGVVKKICTAVPARSWRGCWSAVAVLELRAGEAALLGVVVGSQLQFLFNR